MHEVSGDLVVGRRDRLLQAPIRVVGRLHGAKESSLDGSHAAPEVGRPGATRRSGRNDRFLHIGVRGQPVPDGHLVSWRRPEPTVRCDPEPVEQASWTHFLRRCREEAGQQGERDQATSQRIER